jgi:hypothetical protein
MKDEGLSALGSCRTLGNWTFNITDPGNRCERAYYLLAYLDQVWELVVNGTEYGLIRRGFGNVPAAYGQVARKVPSDGVVPNERSNYPGLTDPLYNFLADGTNHLDIYRNPIGVGRIAEAMGKIGMQDPNSGPPTSIPGLAITAEIFGPNVVSAGEYATWSASVSGGNAPYSYQWSGLARGTGSSIGTTVYSEGTLTIIVQDATGTQVTAQLGVSTPFGGGQCGDRQIICEGQSSAMRASGGHPLSVTRHAPQVVTPPTARRGSPAGGRGRPKRGAASAAPRP